MAALAELLAAGQYKQALLLVDGSSLQRIAYSIVQLVAGVG